jgi:hypothetical protein
MKKIPLLLFLVIAFTMLCCKGDKKETITSNTDIEESKKPEESKEIEILSYVPKVQENIPIEENDNYPKKHVLKDSENYFKISDDNIHVVIPNSDEAMKIIDVFNVSDYNTTRNYNAIVIHMSNGSTNVTAEAVTHKVISNLKISKIKGLSKKNLEDGNLKVFIINEDIIDSNEKAAFKDCVKKETAYSHNKCKLPEEIMALDDKGDPIFKPREQEGDIITSG